MKSDSFPRAVLVTRGRYGMVREKKTAEGDRIFKGYLVSRRNHVVIAGRNLALKWIHAFCNASRFVFLRNYTNSNERLWKRHVLQRERTGGWCWGDRADRGERPAGRAAQLRALKVGAPLAKCRLRRNRYRFRMRPGCVRDASGF